MVTLATTGRAQRATLLPGSWALCHGHSRRRGTEGLGGGAGARAAGDGAKCQVVTRATSVSGNSHGGRRDEGAVASGDFVVVCEVAV